MINISEKVEKYDILKVIGGIADKNNIEAFVIGGFVRDLILGRECYDIDVVSIGKGVFLAEEVAHAVKADNFAVYKNFGTAMIKKNGVQVEFVGARKESYDRNSRKPVVEDGTFEDDQLRRDFTINTLAVCLNKERFGELVDMLNGLEDLKNGIIKTPIDPDLTFSDDPLRMMRAIRFATQLNFKIDKDTFEGIKRQKKRIEIVSNERIRDEINKILMANKPSIGLLLLYECGLMDIIMPYISRLKGKDYVGKFSHKDIFFHTLQVVDNVAKKSDKLMLRWVALLHDVAKPLTKKFSIEHGFSFHGHEEIGARMVKNIFHELRLSNDSVAYVEKLIRLHLRPIIIAQDVVTDSGVRRLVFEAGEDFNDLMILCRADITSHNPAKINEYLNNFDKVEKKVADIAEKDYVRTLNPVLTGDDIMKEFNLSPGPVIGKIKEILKNAILNGEVKNEYNELHEFMLKKCESYLFKK